VPNHNGGAESQWGRRITAGSPKSHNNVTSGSNMEAPNLFLAPGAI